MLLMASQAIILKHTGNNEYIQVDDLFDDEDDQRETLASIQAAEKEHGHKIKEAFNNESMRDTVQEKTVLKFKDDEFVKNDMIYPSMEEKATKSFLQIDDDVFAGRPISEVLVELNHPADSGDFDDEEQEEAETLESLKSAERVSGVKMNGASYSEKNLSDGAGNMAQDFLADDNRIYTKYLSDAFTDKEAEDKMAKKRLDAEKAHQDELVKEKASKKVEVKKAEDFLAMHFQNYDDDFVQIRFIDGSDAMIRDDSN
jgi:hypothetical protein